MRIEQSLQLFPGNEAQYGDPRVIRDGADCASSADYRQAKFWVDCVGLAECVDEKVAAFLCESFLGDEEDLLVPVILYAFVRGYFPESGPNHSNVILGYAIVFHQVFFDIFTCCEDVGYMREAPAFYCVYLPS